MKVDIPGPGGSLGECVVCGKNFAKEVILNETIQMFGIDGTHANLPAHKECWDRIRGIKDWRLLPDGPLKKEYSGCLQLESK